MYLQNKLLDKKRLAEKKEKENIFLFCFSATNVTLPTTQR